MLLLTRDKLLFRWSENWSLCLEHLCKHSTLVISWEATQAQWPRSPVVFSQAVLLKPDRIVKVTTIKRNIYKRNQNPKYNSKKKILKFSNSKNYRSRLNSKSNSV